jgi:hypothetical protein
MARSGPEVADVFRRYGDAYREQHGATLCTEQRRVMTAIELCRTAALGGHVEQCDQCGHQRISYNSCLMGKIRYGESAIGWVRDPAVLLVILPASFRPLLPIRSASLPTTVIWPATADYRRRGCWSHISRHRRRFGVYAQVSADRT